MARGEARRAALVRARAEDALFRVRRGGQERRGHGAPLARRAARPRGYRSLRRSSRGLVPGGPVGALIERYRCLSCHQIGEQGRRHLDRPAHVRGEQGQARLARRLPDALLFAPPDPRGADARLRMPREEATQLADAIESFYVDPRSREDPFAGRPASDADRRRAGLYTTLGCRACHILGSSGGYYGPPLTDTGKRLKPGWVFTWLKGPQRWRADVRCPNYGLTDTDALRLTAYLETLPPHPPGGGGRRRDEDARRYPGRPRAACRLRRPAREAPAAKPRRRTARRALLRDTARQGHLPPLLLRHATARPAPATASTPSTWTPVPATSPIRRFRRRRRTRSWPTRSAAAAQASGSPP